MFGIALFALLCVYPSNACRCPPLSLEAYYAQASSVVAATVVSVSEPFCAGDDPECAATAQRISYVLLVSDLYKGCAPLSLILLADTSVSSSECSLRLELNERWLLFLNGSQPATGAEELFQVNSCQGNRLLGSVSQEEVEWLQEASEEEGNGCITESSA